MNCAEPIATIPAVASRRAGLRRRRIAAVLLAGATLLAMGGCKRKAAPPPVAAPTDPAVVKPREPLASQLKTMPAGTAPITTIVRVPGRIDFDAQRVARIGANVTGRITELDAMVGQPVKGGDLLARLNSTELGAAHLAYAKAVAHRELQQRAVERARLLLASDVIGTAELQRRQSELRVAEAERRSAAEQLRVMGVREKDLARSSAGGAADTIASITSTIDGVVVERTVNRGQVVQPSDTLFTVADLSHVWAVALVPESEAQHVRVGQTARIEIPAVENGEPVSGELIWVSDIVDPQTRMIDVRSDIENGKRLLKPGMLVNMVIESGALPQLVVPTSAVVRELNVDNVFVKTGDNEYRLTPLRLGDEHGDLRVVESGITEGQVIVIDGAFHLNNERKSAEMEGP